MIKKIVGFILALSILASCAAFCAGCDIDLTEYDLTFTDMAGREISLTPSKVQKVVCVGAGALRLYSYVGDMDKLCAVEEIEGSRTSGRISLRAYQIAYEDLFKDLIEEGKTAGAGGPAAQELKTEILAKLEPDVVFSCLTMDADKIAESEKIIGCPIVTLAYGKQKAFSEQLLDSLTIIGEVCGTQERAEELCNYITATKADIAAQAADKTGKKVYLACNSNWGVKGFLSTAKNYPLFTISGIPNVMDDPSMLVNSDGYADLEAVVASDADVIILDAGGYNVFKGEYNEVGSNLPEALQGMSAFAAKEVYQIMPNNAYDANVEMYFINAYYCLNVAYGLDIDIEQKAKEITQKFLNKAMYDELLILGGYRQLDLPAELN